MDMAANRVAKIVSDLKNFARQSNVVDKRSIQINTAAENALRLAQTSLRKSGVELEVDLASDLPLLKGNLQNIEQIILNLVINAVQAIDHDQGVVRIATGFQSKDRRIFVSITDNGCGVAPEISDKLFDPFVTDKQAEGGTGLGLSVTYSLVNAHDGEIVFQSTKGKGTTFTVFFPTIVKDATGRILVVDDDKSIRDMLTKALSEAGPYLMDEASNRLEAVRTIKAAQVESYFQLIHDQVLTFSESRMVADATQQLAEAFKKAREENDVTTEDLSQMKDDLKRYYSIDFAREYQARNGQEPAVEVLI